ncbi:hypothetical protein B0H14DRAFT_3503511 [Mycena olivaceomarginata]|nr:hypothetical protein B0H14DRAFT_3503511 [Mycena olivaceomarginata]
MPALTLSFLLPGLSPAASLSLTLLPWLLLLLALSGYLARHQTDQLGMRMRMYSRRSRQPKTCTAVTRAP